MEIKFLMLLTYVFYPLTVAKEEQKTKLLLVQILFRHGDRSPRMLYPNDPNPASFWAEGLGKLTILGKKQQYALGKYLRSRYQNFTTSNPLEVNVTSCEADRCLESAATNVAAFYAPKGEWRFEKHLKWQPIPVYYTPKMADKYLEINSYCPRATEERKRIVNSPGGQRFIAEHKEMFTNLSFYSGYPLVNWTDASYLYDILFIEKKYNLTIPSWVNPYWDELGQVCNLSYYWNWNSPLIRRLRAGPLLGKIIENMLQKIKGNTPNSKFYIYFSHDENVAGTLIALNLFNMIRPPYGASVLFELHENVDGTKAIRLLYQNSSAIEEEIHAPNVLILEGCMEFCPLDYFIKYTQHLIPEDWAAECRLDITCVEKMQTQQIILGCFFFLLAVVSVFIYIMWRIHLNKTRFSYMKHKNLPSTVS